MKANNPETITAGVVSATESRQLLDSRVHGDCSHHVLYRVRHTLVGRTLE